MKSQPRKERDERIYQAILMAEAYLPPSQIYTQLGWTQPQYSAFKKERSIHVTLLTPAEEWLESMNFFPKPTPPNHVRELITTYNKTNTTICTHCLTTIPNTPNAIYCSNCGKQLTS